MSEKLWVVNASPLISLAKISQIELLPKISDQMIIPMQVAQEIDQGPENDLARIWLMHQGKKWIKDACPVKFLPI